MKLNDKQFQALQSCKSPEEVIQKAAEHNVALTEEQAVAALNSVASIEITEDNLSEIAGGGCMTDNRHKCTSCKQQFDYDLHDYTTTGELGTLTYHYCDACWEKYFGNKTC